MINLDYQLNAITCLEFNFFHECEYFSCVFVCALCVCLVPIRARIRCWILSHGTGVTEGWELPRGSLELGPLEELQGLLTNLM